MKAWHTLLIALLLGCQPWRQEAADESQTGAQLAASDISLNKLDAAADTTAAVSSPMQSLVLQQGRWEEEPRQLIKTGNITLECADFQKMSRLVVPLVKQFQGWVASENETRTDFQWENIMEIRVPVDRFDQLVEALCQIDARVVEKMTGSEDVTAAIVDTKGRLEAKRKIREQYLALLQQASTMEDILKLQERIDGITEDMEASAYRVKHLQAQAAVSTIHFTYFQPLEGMPVQGFGGRLLDALNSGYILVKNLSVGVVTLWPLWLLAAAGWFYWKRRKRSLPAAA